eukprot:m.25847 g.25847  ORF g.25847 m.25847 type:complete len:337 (-) comp8769_c0_seq1:303-1313(-)
MPPSRKAALKEKRALEQLQACGDRAEAATKVVLLGGIGCDFGTQPHDVFEHLTTFDVVCKGVALPPDQARVRAFVPNPARHVGHAREASVSTTATQQQCDAYASTMPPGLLLLDEFITIEEERELLERVTQQREAEWFSLSQRKVCHYGHYFDYTSFQVTTDDVPPIPVWLAPIITRITELPITNGHGPANQLTINSYDPGDGIAPHVDAPWAFQEYIYILSLESGIAMQFDKIVGDPTSRSHGQHASCESPQTAHDHTYSSASTSTEPPSTSSAVAPSVELYLHPRSLVVVTGEARYNWTHTIPSRKTDIVDGIQRHRSHRVSLTLRAVKSASKQ